MCIKKDICLTVFVELVVILASPVIAGLALALIRSDFHLRSSDPLAFVQAYSGLDRTDNLCLFY